MLFCYNTRRSFEKYVYCLLPFVAFNSCYLVVKWKTLIRLAEIASFEEKLNQISIIFLYGEYWKNLQALYLLMICFLHTW